MPEKQKKLYEYGSNIDDIKSIPIMFMNELIVMQAMDINLRGQ